MIRSDTATTAKRSFSCWDNLSQWHWKEAYEEVREDNEADPLLESEETHGEWIIDREHKGTPDDPILMALLH